MFKSDIGALMNKRSVSELLHLVSLRVKSSQKNLETGMLIISIDVDVGRKELGTINKGQNDFNISPSHSEYLIGQIEEQSFPDTCHLRHAGSVG
jgi:hypothetical protein